MIYGIVSTILNGDLIMPNVTIYHNPHCSKSRQALALLEAHHIQPKIIEYLKTPPSIEALKMILKQLNLPALKLIRTQEKIFKEKNLGNPHLSEDQLIDTMISYPALIERPIIIANGRAIIGRPPEKVLELI